MPKYSVIIPTYNRAKTLALTLDSVCHQTIPLEKYEVLVIDDGSIDNTREAVAEFMKQYSDYDIKYFYQKNAGPAKARNLGIKESKGEIIFFTDDDCTVPPNWMEMLLDGYRRYPDVVGVGGWHETNFPKTSFLQRCENALDNKFGGGILDTEIKTNLYFFPYIGTEPANLSYKKSILEECGGFDENLRSIRWVAKEFNIWAFARGYSFLHLPLKVKRIKKSGIKDSLYQYIREGGDAFYLHRKYPRLINDAYRGFRGFLNISIGLLAYAEISYFYLAYCISTLFKAGGRIFTKYLERPAVKEIGILPNETFEISKHLSGEEKSIQTNGRPFNKSTFQIKELIGDFYSVVIPTYNRAECLIKALENLVNQTIPPAYYEIVVVDDGSTDDTPERIEEFKKRYSDRKIYYFRKQNAGPAAARNFGIERVRGKFVFFTDDDCTVPNDWMETILAGFKKYPDAVGVGGWIWPPEGELEKSAVSRFLHFESFFSHHIVGSYIRSHEILSNDPLMFFGTFAYNTANVCYRKEALQKVGGFREDFYWPGSEDTDLGLRIALAGFPILYLPFHVIHPKNMNLLDFYRLHFRRGANNYLSRVVNRKDFERLKPGFAKENTGSMTNFISRFMGPEKFLALLQWLSINAGIRYMKNRLAKRDKPGSESSASR